MAILLSGSLFATVPVAAPVAAGAIADQNYPQDAAITPLDISADFTGSGITYALAPSSAALPAGLSLSSAGLLTGTPTTQAGQVNIVVRGTNSGGFDDTAFGVTIGAAASVGEEFGALTREGAGGIAVTGTSITSGDPSGHWQISGGVLTPSATGEDTISGTYNLTLNDASTVDITVVANKASVASAAQLTTAWAALPAATATGILIRDGDYSGEARQTLAAKAFTNEVVVEPHTTFVAGADPKSSTFTVTLPGFVLAADTSNTRWRGLKFYETLAGASLETDGVFQVTDGGTTTANITIEDCEVASFDFRTAYDNGVFADASNFAGPYASQGLYFAALDAIRGIKANDVNNFRALRNYIHDVTRGIVLGSVGIDAGNRSRLEGNWIEDVVSNFTTAGGQTNGLDIWDNLMINCWGSDGEVPSNPTHSAVGLSFDNPSTGSFQNVTVKGNLGHVGWARQKYTVDSGDTYTVTNAATGMKFNDPQNTYAYQNITVAHNLIVSHGLCCEFSGAQNIDIYNNTLSDEDYQGGTGPSYYFQGAENVRMWNNLGPLFVIGANDGGTENGSPMVTTTDTMKQYGNFCVAQDVGDLGYNTIFEGIAGSLDFLTHDQLAAAYTPISTSYALTATEKKGALGTGYYSAGGNDTAPAFADPTATSTNYTPVTTSWPGTAYLLRGGGLTGAADGREVTIAWQGALDATQDGVQFYSIQALGLRIAARHLGGDDIRFYVENAAGTVILQADMADGPQLNSALGKHAWAFSADLTTGQVTMALNGKPLPIPLNVGGTNGVTFDDIDWTTTQWAINSNTSGGDVFTGDFDACLISDTFIDLDTTAGLNKLFASDGLFKDWGAAGVNINGGSELVVIQGANAAALNGGTANSGTGGAFTMTGSVTDAAGPSGLVVDEGASSATFSTSGPYRVADLGPGDTLVVTNAGPLTGAELVGPGAPGGYRAGGGGGAGELVQIPTNGPNLTVQTYVHDGGTIGTVPTDQDSKGTAGLATRLLGQTVDDIALTALGGAPGGSLGASARDGDDGGSGGGAGGSTGALGGASTASDGVGNAGGDSGSGLGGGGGGGADGPGTTATTTTGAAPGAGRTSIAPGFSDTLGRGGTGGSTSGTNGVDGTDPGEGGEGGAGNFGSRDPGNGAPGRIRLWWPI